jgi:hypothetical protein
MDTESSELVSIAVLQTILLRTISFLKYEAAFDVAAELAQAGAAGKVPLITLPRWKLATHKPLCLSIYRYGGTLLFVILRKRKIIHIRNENLARLGKCPAWTRHFRTS